MRTKSLKQVVAIAIAASCYVNYIAYPLETKAATSIIVDGLPKLPTPSSVDKPTKTSKLSLDFSISSENVTISDEQQNVSLYQGSASSIEGGFSYAGVTLSEDERRYIANVVEHEVGGCSDQLNSDPKVCPRVNVACSVLNRFVTDYWEFPSSIEEVILQSNAYENIGPYWNRTDYATPESYAAVDYALANGDITGGCYWFRNPVITGWNSFFDEADTITWMFMDSAGHEYYKLK